MKRLTTTLLLFALLAGCAAPDEDDLSDAGADLATADATTGSDAGTEADGSGGDDVGAADMGSDEETDLGPIGGDRPVDIRTPSDYDSSNTYPVVVLLHGYTATAEIQNAYFRASTLVDEYQFILVLPDGTTDSMGNQFWNATNACCDFYNTGVDDSAYLRGVVDDVLDRYAADAERVYFMGHSNGGYMSYRMACDHADVVAAVASLAGSSWQDPMDCAASESVGALQMHGTDDPTVQYDGMPPYYPGASEVIQRWAERANCSAEPNFAGSADYDGAVEGEETDVQRYSDCDDGTSVELWAMNGSGHIPSVGEDFTRAILDFLFEQRL